MARLFLQLAILSACFGICGVGEFQLLPGVVWCESLKYQLKTFCLVAGPTVRLLRGPPPEVAQQAGTLFTTVTMATEGLSTAYVGADTCTAVAGDINVESDVFQVLLSGRHRC